MYDVGFTVRPQVERCRMFGKDFPLRVRFPAGNQCYAGEKKILQSHLPKYHRKGVCMQGLCTMIIDVTDVLTTTYCTSHEDRC